MRRALPTLCRALRPLLLGAAMGLMLGAPAPAQSHLCDAAAELAARETGVPLPVLLGLTRVETGRSRDGAMVPWPWTLNMGGDGAWHDSEATALAAADLAIAAGRRNVDLGCFQINYHWHGAAFASLAEMLDPVANARYAARFLTELHASLGDWAEAAGAFHSRNPAQANRYLDRYREVMAALQNRVDAPPLAAATRGPSPLPMQARPPLFGPGPPGLLRPARPVRAAPARPLWEP
jgi:hypothetical protein